MAGYTDTKQMFYGASPKIFALARSMRQNMTEAELILWIKLKNREIFKAKFRRQHPAGMFIIDFYCHEYKLAIELDGPIHDIDDNPEKDTNRTSLLEKLGIKVIRFSNYDVFNNIDQVISTIQKEFH
jgi:very-short-patch-repair endonuclease